LIISLRAVLPARQAHDLKVASSNLAPATNQEALKNVSFSRAFAFPIWLKISPVEAARGWSQRKIGEGAMTRL